MARNNGKRIGREITTYMSKKLFLFLVFYFLFTGNRCFAAASSLQEEILYYFNTAIALAGILAVIILVFSGIEFIYSAGNPGKIGEAKKRAVSAVLGLIILLSSFLIIRTINPKLENLDPTEDLKMIGPFLFFGGRDGSSKGSKSGCEINTCLGLDGSCSWENCRAYDYGNCPSGSGCPDSEGACSGDNCINSANGCGLNQCLGSDGTCSWENCNWAIAKPSPMSLENTDVIRQKYSKIIWMTTNIGLSENLISTCDQNNPNAVYVLYLYKDYNFKNLYALSRMKCDENWVDISEARSYMLVKETPGVYFYGNKDCYPKGDSPPASHAQSIPEGWSEEVKSVRIVNGPDLKKGPFFGLIYFNDFDYKTTKINPQFKHFVVNKFNQQLAYDNYSHCYSFGDGNFIAKNGSWVIYSWVGFEEDGQTFAIAGDGVTLYSRTGWLGGNYEVAKGQNMIAWQVELQNTPVFYSSNSGVPVEEQRLCPYFYPSSSCLKSFEIKGDYLVLVSSVPDRPYLNEPPNIALSGHAQAFPISPRLQEVYKDREGYSVEKGTPELMLDYIGWLKSANYMEVIPLTGKSN